MFCESSCGLKLHVEDLQTDSRHRGKISSCADAHRNSSGFESNAKLACGVDQLLVQALAMEALRDLGKAPVERGCRSSVRTN